jgi:toxin ParE1/3/4
VKVHWTPDALTRLLEIEDHIARDNRIAAVKLTERLVARTRALGDFPKMGRRASDLPGDGCRELLEGNYRIIYRVRSNVVDVLTVFEGHRLPPDYELDEDPEP